MSWSDGVPRLDILINNAAQTLIDSIAVESRAIAKEGELRVLSGSGPLLVDDDRAYVSKVRGGTLSLASGMIKAEKEQLLRALSVPQIKTVATGSGTLSQYSTRPQSSWTQSLAEIPYEDINSAHSSTPSSPSILIRELLPLTGTEYPH